MFNLSASATRDGLSLIAVVMKAPTSSIRFNNATTLLNYGFNNFEFVSLAKKEDIIQTVKIDKGTKSYINAIFSEDVGALVSKGNDININKNIELPNTISAPIEKGETIGNVTFSLNDEVINSASLVSDTTVPKINIFTMTGNVIHNWFNLCR